MIHSYTHPHAVLKERGLVAKKSWGQNFLQDQTVLECIAKASGAHVDVPVLELGAGLGALTYHLLQQGGEVVALERDRDVIPILKEEFSAYATFSVLEQDAAKVSYETMYQHFQKKFVVAGNLPYQLSSRLLVSMAEAQSYIASVVVLIQKEVAERLVAEPGSRDYGLLSVLVQRSFQASIVRIVPPHAFFPAPKVHSAVVVLKPILTSIVQDQESFVLTAKAAFSARRKTLKNALKNALNITASALEKAIVDADLNPECRAETLNIADFERLSQSMIRHGCLIDSPKNA